MPVTFEKFIGNGDVVKAIKAEIEACRVRGVRLRHGLITGYPGTGKTTLANIVATELGCNFVDVDCGAFDGTIEDLIVSSGRCVVSSRDAGVGFDLKVKPTLVLFDEAHNLSTKQQQELLKPMLEQRLLCKDGTRVDISAVTFLFATTNADMLGSALKTRCEGQYHLERYTPAELACIINKFDMEDREWNEEEQDWEYDEYTITLGETIARAIADRARFTPRIAGNLARGYYNYCRTKTKSPLEVKTVFNLETLNEFFELQGIGPKGLNKKDVQYLRTLAENHKMGLATIAAYMELGKEEVQTDVEPFLRYLRFINMVPGGRTLSALGRQFLMEYDEELEARKQANDAIRMAIG